MCVFLFRWTVHRFCLPISFQLVTSSGVIIWGWAKPMQKTEQDPWFPGVSYPRPWLWQHPGGMVGTGHSGYLSKVMFSSSPMGWGLEIEIKLIYRK